MSQILELNVYSRSLAGMGFRLMKEINLALVAKLG